MRGLAVLLACGVFLVPGCAERITPTAGTFNTTTTTDLMTGGMAKAPAPGMEKQKDDVPGPGGGREAEPRKPDDAPKSQKRMIVYTGRIEVYVKDFEAARDEMLALLKEQDGYAASSDQSGEPGEPRHGTWTLRVPVVKFDSFLNAVAKLGELRRRTLESEDITDRYYDTQAETTNFELREKALRKLYDEKIAGTKLSDLLDVDRELSAVRGQINLRKGQLQRWDKLTTFATVYVTLWTRQGYVPEESPTFFTTIGRTFGESIDALVRFGKGIVLLVVAVVPWLAVTAVAVTPMWLMWRARRPRSAAPPG